MIGTIYLEDLRVHCIVGILDFERKNKQDIFLDIEVDCDFNSARESEHITKTVDYVQITQLIEKLIDEKKYQLIETLAEDACTLLFKTWDIILRCKVKVKKPHAIAQAKYASVSVERSRNP